MVAGAHRIRRALAKLLHNLRRHRARDHRLHRSRPPSFAAVIQLLWHLERKRFPQSMYSRGEERFLYIRLDPRKVVHGHERGQHIYIIIALLDCNAPHRNQR